MKLRYIGSSFGVAGLTDGKVYECLGVEFEGTALRIIDDDLDDWNYNDDPEWKPGYLYSITNPAPSDGSSPGGRWEIVEDDEQGTLAKIIPR